MPTRKMHPALVGLIAYPFAAWLTMGGMLLATSIADHTGPPDRTEVIVLLAAPVLLPFLMLMGLLSGDSTQLKQVVECTFGLAAAWFVCWVIVRFIASRRRVALRDGETMK